MSRKTVNITVTKSATFNVGNFSNVRPEISVTLNGVPVDEKLKDEYFALMDLVDAMFAVNTIELMDETQSFNEVGPNRYLEGLRTQEGQMEEIIERYHTRDEE